MAELLLVQLWLWSLSPAITNPECLPDKTEDSAESLQTSL